MGAYFNAPPMFDSVLPQDVQQVLDLGTLLDELLVEIEKSDIAD